jgi:hypothetical protein
MTTSDGKHDFFVSFTKADRPWAAWIAWVLEDAGYRVLFQDWDFNGGNFMLQMNNAHKRSRRTVGVLSPDYLDSGFAAAEWTARLAQDATSDHDLLIPVRVCPCEVEGLLAQIIYVDLVGCGDETAARDRILRRVKGIRLKPDEPPLFPGKLSHHAVPERPAFPAAAQTSGRAAATKYFSFRTHRPEADKHRKRSMDVIRDRVFELMERHDIDLPTIAEILEVKPSVLEREELLDRLDNPTLDRLANLFCIERKWLTGQSEYPMQAEETWYKRPASFLHHLLALEKKDLHPEVYFMKPLRMDPDKAMDEEGLRQQVGICIARVHETSSGKSFMTFEPWAWEPWSYQRSRIDFLAIFMIFDRTFQARLLEDMKRVGMQDEYSWDTFHRINRIRRHERGIDEDAIAGYRNCKLFLKELIDASRFRGYVGWCPDVFTDREMPGSRVRPEEIDFIEERYFEILKALVPRVPP